MGEVTACLHLWLGAGEILLACLTHRRCFYRVRAPLAQTTDIGAPTEPGRTRALRNAAEQCNRHRADAHHVGVADHPRYRSNLIVSDDPTRCALPIACPSCPPDAHASAPAFRNPPPYHYRGLIEIRWHVAVTRLANRVCCFLAWQGCTHLPPQAFRLIRRLLRLARLAGRPAHHHLHRLRGYRNKYIPQP